MESPYLQNEGIKIFIYCDANCFVTCVSKLIPVKSEERIIELLADYLKKGDQLLDRMDRSDKNVEQTNKNVEIMSRAIVEHSIKFNKVSEDIKQLREDHGAMLKELVSLSKRVAVVEGKI
jgi:septal ring factor EnvC (AmiA/AmiB activator)